VKGMRPFGNQPGRASCQPSSVNPKEGFACRRTEDLRISHTAGSEPSPPPVLGGPMFTPRRIFVDGVASVICAPAIVRAESLMSTRAFIAPMQPVHAGFIERLHFHWMDQVLKNGWTTERTRDVRRHFRKRGAAPSHLCPNARVAGVIRLA
jgi:hypothetical protein